MGDQREEVGGIVGGIAGIFMWIGSAIFSLFFGSRFTEKRIARGTKIVLGGGIAMFPIGSYFAVKNWAQAFPDFVLWQTLLAGAGIGFVVGASFAWFLAHLTDVN